MFGFIVALPVDSEKIASDIDASSPFRIHDLLASHSLSRVLINPACRTIVFEFIGPQGIVPKYNVPEDVTPTPITIRL